jgi:hypothetical protein
MVAGCTGVVVFVYGVFRNLKKDFREQIAEVRNNFLLHFNNLRIEMQEFRSDVKDDCDILFDQIKENSLDINELRIEVHTDLSDVKERLSFLEAAILYTTPIEPVEANPRSKAARDMWQRRKQKRLESKNG